MSAFGGKADVRELPAVCPLIARSGHSRSDKTFIGRIERGFDFLGYHFSPAGLTVAKETAARFVARAIRLYEQEPGKACASSRLGLYVRRWVRWVQAGLPEVVRHLKNRKFTKLADAVEGTRNIWPAEVDLKAMARASHEPMTIVRWCRSRINWP